MRPKSHSVRRDTEPVISWKSLRSEPQSTSRETMRSQSSSLRSKIW